MSFLPTPPPPPTSTPSPPRSPYPTLAPSPPAATLAGAGDYQPVPFVLAGQLLGYFFSLAKGLNPDKPSVRGTISRVVSGVKIYDF